MPIRETIKFRIAATMAKSAFALTLAVMPTIGAFGPGVALADCLPNAVRSVAGIGRLVISEAAITRNFNECPTNDLGRKLAPRQPIYIWLRLEGDKEFTKTARSHDQFTIRVLRSGAIKGHWKELVIANRKLGLTSIRSEAELPDNNGFFDWRLYAHTSGFTMPGIYKMVVLYGGRPVCQAIGNCDIVFEIDGGK